MTEDDSAQKQSYCPVHSIKCSEIKDAHTLIRKRVPIWVFLGFCVCLGTILGYQLTLVQKNANTMEKVVHGLNEVAVNQTRVMEKIGLEFHKLPSYDSK